MQSPENAAAKRRARLLRLMPMMICAVFIIVCVVFARSMDFEDVLNYTPRSAVAAAFVIWIFYALKSLSIMIPATILFIAAGHIYSYGIAVAVNIIGLAVSFAIPYAIGRFSGAELIDEIAEKHPKVSKALDYGQKNNFFTVYASRAVTVLPNDLMSMVHGALKMPFPSFMLGSIVGLLPEMLVETYIGGALSDLSLKSVLVMIGLIALTAAFSFFVNKKIKSMTATK